MALHSLVQEVVTSFLDTVDAEAPGLVEGLYLTGSVALDDFRPHESDIDFVAVMATHPDTASIATLERAHARLHARYRRPFFGSTPLNRGQAAWATSRSQLGGRPRRLTVGTGTGTVSSSCIVQR